MEILEIDKYLNFRIIDVFPKWIDVDTLVSLASITTISKKDFYEKYKKYSKEELKKLIEELNKESTRRGHASVLTTPHIAISLKGSRVLDLFFTAFPFGSYLVMSQRYVKAIYALNPKGKDYSKVYKKQYEDYEKLLKLGIKKEIARRVLGLGFNSHMLLVYPLESILHIIKYSGIVDLPHEISLVIEKFKEIEKKMPNLFKYGLQSPQYNIRFPSIFNKVNLVNYEDGIKIINESLREKGILDEFIKNIKLTRSWEEFRKVAIKLGYIASLYPNEYWVRLKFSCSLACFNELKRHRTLTIIPESIYNVFKNLDKRIYIPNIKEEALKIYLDSINDSIDYIEKEDGLERIYILPQAIKIAVEVEINLQNLISPFLFYRIRSCFYAEEEIRNLTRKIPYVIKEQSKYKEYAEKLFSVMVKEHKGKEYPLSKCFLGICPEKYYCDVILSLNENYNRKLHEEINNI